jgi:hypothetical protein
MKGRDHSEDVNVIENNIRMDFRYIKWEVVDWIHLTKDRDQWKAFVDTVMDLRVS